MHKFVSFLIETFLVRYINFERGLTHFKDKFDTPFFALPWFFFIHLTSSAVKYSKFYLAKAKLYICNLVEVRIHVHIILFLFCFVLFFCLFVFLISRYFPLFSLIYVKLYKRNISGGICSFTLNSSSVYNTRTMYYCWQTGEFRFIIMGGGRV